MRKRHQEVDSPGHTHQQITTRREYIFSVRLGGAEFEKRTEEEEKRTEEKENRKNKDVSFSL